MALITGARTGLGYDLSNVYAANGFDVVGLGHRLPSGDEFWQKHNFYQLDLSRAQEEDFQAVTKGIAGKVGQLDTLILNAGINCVGPFEKKNWEEQRAVLDINYHATVSLCRILLQNGNLQSGSKIVFISSLADDVGYPGASVYAASKLALSAYARSLKAALKKGGISVSWVKPGPIDTPHAEKYSPLKDNSKNRYPAERLAQEIFAFSQNSNGAFVPGFSTKIISLIGRFAPRFATKLMRKILFIPLLKALK